MLSTAILAWLKAILGTSPKKVVALAGDASFRQYYRLYLREDKSLILMVNPSASGNNGPFIQVADLLDQWGVMVPERMALNHQLGTLLLSDMGDTLFLNALTKKTELGLYHKALDTLCPMQKGLKTNEAVGRLPAFDKTFMMMEMNYLSMWLLNTLLNISLSNKEQQQLQENFVFIAEAVLKQPYVFIHRDYHSRNLMVLPGGPLGVLDFQDAMIGPLTYDLVSLLRDCYYVISPERVQLLLQHYHQKHCMEGVDFQQLQEWFHITAIQRHVKVAGIFARLAYRDGKRQFIQDIPVALQYLVDTLPRYKELHFLYALIEERIVPALKQQQVSLS